MHKIARDLTVELGGDRPGTLGRALEAIAKTGINLDGFAEVAGILHVLTADPARTRRALESGGFTIARDDEVVVVELPDRPGIAASLFKQLADANVNVNFTYVATNNRVSIGAANVARAAEVIARAGATA